MLMRVKKVLKLNLIISMNLILLKFIEMTSKFFGNSRLNNSKDNKDKKDDNVVDADFEEVKEENKDGNQEKSA